MNYEEHRRNLEGEYRARAMNAISGSGQADYSQGKLSSGQIGSATQIPPALDEARATLKQANAVTSRIMQLADRLCGPIPPKTGIDVSDRDYPGEIDRFRAEMRDTRQAMIFADDALTRIEQELIG